MIDKKRIENLIYDLLEAIGEDPSREGIKETPKRVAKMYTEIFSGMESDPNDHIKMFEEVNQGDKIIFVKDIPFYSICEHHLLPFFGVIHIAYIPKDNKIIGLSKLARIVNCYARRLQVQERLTNQISDFIFSKVGAASVAVFAEAEHMCMTIRGIKAFGAKTKTYDFKGILNYDKEKREELYRLL